MRSTPTVLPGHPGSVPAQNVPRNSNVLLATNVFHAGQAYPRTADFISARFSAGPGADDSCWGYVASDPIGGSVPSIIVGQTSAAKKRPDATASHRPTRRCFSAHPEVRKGPVAVL